MKPISRAQEVRIRGLLKSFRVVTVIGARQVGKTTTVRSIVDNDPDSRYFTLDSNAVRDLAAEDPESLVDTRASILAIDEVQRVPEILLAVKSVVDSSNRPGQFLLTGSADLMRLPTIPDTLPGRNAFVRLRGLAEVEIVDQATPGAAFQLVDELFQSEVPELDDAAISTVELGQRLSLGSYPGARLNASVHVEDFFDSYIDAMLGHEVDEIARIDSKRGLRHVLSQVATRTSSLLSMSDIGRSAGISQHTVERYLETLQNLFLVERLPAWSRNIDQRQVRMPKAYLSDAGMAAHLLGLDPRQIETVGIGNAMGQLFETFVINEFLKLNDFAETRADAFHYRDRDKHEVDLVLERRNGDIIAIEAKKSSRLSAADSRGLKRLRERVGDQFKAGLIVYSGSQTLQLGNRLYAVPVTALWR